MKVRSFLEREDNFKSLEGGFRVKTRLKEFRYEGGLDFRFKGQRSGTVNWTVKTRLLLGKASVKRRLSFTAFSNYFYFDLNLC